MRSVVSYSPNTAGSIPAGKKGAKNEKKVQQQNADPGYRGHDFRRDALGRYHALRSQQVRAQRDMARTGAQPVLYRVCRDDSDVLLRTS